jgi:AraC family transcriptional regulator, regulatory protein of adaptative response / methylated-DNA-[protein]-cysteine methyltransferase
VIVQGARLTERRGVTELDDDTAWLAVETRDRAADGTFVFGVRTTGVYCRPSCPARRPKRANVSFFASPKEAELAGYRACMRCDPQGEGESGIDQIVRQAKEYLQRNSERNVTLDELARVVGASPFHLQRKFKEIVGVSPKRYQDARKSEQLKARLRAGETVSRATFEAGFGSARAAYANAGGQLGMTPGQYRRGGKGSNIEYMIVPSSLGRVLVAATERGVCAVAIGDKDQQLERELRNEFPQANVKRSRSNDELRAWVEAVVNCAEGECVAPEVPIDLFGTEFQLRVWEALRKIPFGARRTYGEIAHSVGTPKASRAVGTACGKNRVALLVPCHRAVRSDGSEGGYRWGEWRKGKLLERERSSEEGEHEG